MSVPLSLHPKDQSVPACRAARAQGVFWSPWQVSFEDAATGPQRSSGKNMARFGVSNVKGAILEVES